ncbi:hypothetical protein LguiA_020400 [Lonicera macranthoides]
MPRTIARNLNLCFTKIKPPQQDHNRPLPPNSTASFLIKNFNTLYSPSHSKSSSEDFPPDSDSDSDTTAAPPPDFATVFASNRFFFSSPGRSNSIVESSSSSFSSSSSPENSKSPIVVGDGIPILTFSLDPYTDFRRSMQEMVDSHNHRITDVRSGWDYLHELLTCYLALNPKSTHKFIMGAFADLLISLMPAPAEGGGRRESGFNDGGCKISRRC